ncbi:MAG TPA: DUF4197 domain-containing protein [Verrucomicrobiae bacterium]|nr:DUF4197 domain-containing protein [Verrucomicrobiae bacterium]
MKPQFGKVVLSALGALLVVQNAARAGVLDFLGLGGQEKNTAAVPAAVSALSQDQVVDGLKEALSKGVEQAVGRLGHDGGFLTNLNVKIPMPEKLRTVEKTLRTVHQDKLADEFIDTMNHAAEQAVPEAAVVFSDAIKNMSVADAKAILIGTNNAATQYFRTATETNLYEKFLPIVKKATDQTGVTSAYKRLMEKVDSGSSLGGFGSFGRSLLGSEAVDVDGYVTNKALDGLFKIVAEEEQRIRENPIARTSDLLQKVFGAVRK